MQWEYTTVKLATKGFLGGKFDETRLDSFMNQLGSEGWELVCDFDTNKAYGERLTAPHVGCVLRQTADRLLREGRCPRAPSRRCALRRCERLGSM